MIVILIEPAWTWYKQNSKRNMIQRSAGLEGLIQWLVQWGQIWDLNENITKKTPVWTCINSFPWRKVAKILPRNSYGLEFDGSSVSFLLRCSKHPKGCSTTPSAHRSSRIGRGNCAHPPPAPLETDSLSGDRNITWAVYNIPLSFHWTLVGL